MGFQWQAWRTWYGPEAAGLLHRGFDLGNGALGKVQAMERLQVDTC